MSNYYTEQWQFTPDGYLSMFNDEGRIVIALTREQAKQLWRELTVRHEPSAKRYHDGTLGADEPEPPEPRGLHRNNGHFDVV